MKKLISNTMLVLFVGVVMISCADAQADEIYQDLPIEKSNDNNDNTDHHKTEGPLGNG